MGERLLIRSSTLTSKPPLDLRSIHLLHNTDKTCTTHDVRAVTSAGQNDRRSYRSAVHRGRIHTTKDYKTIERDLALAPGMSSVGPTASLRSQEGARAGKSLRSFGADGASDDGVDSASDDE